MQSPESHYHTGFLMEGKTPIKPTIGESEQNTYSQQAGSPPPSQKKVEEEAEMYMLCAAGWMVTPSPPTHPPTSKDVSTQNLWLWPYLEKSFFTDVIKLKILKWDHPGVGCSLNQMASVLKRKGQKTERRRSEIVVMHLQAKDHQGFGRPPEAGRGALDR